MKEVFNDFSQRVLIKSQDGVFFIYIKDQEGTEAEICIPEVCAIEVANAIIAECNK